MKHEYTTCKEYGVLCNVLMGACPYDLMGACPYDFMYDFMCVRKIRIINLTPHSITVRKDDGTEITYPSEGIARVNTTLRR